MHKGYKCLDVTTGRVYISHDVVFDEAIFPFSTLTLDAGTRLPHDLLLLPNDNHDVAMNSSVSNQTNALPMSWELPSDTAGSGSSLPLSSGPPMVPFPFSVHPQESSFPLELSSEVSTRIEVDQGSNPGLDPLPTELSASASQPSNDAVPSVLPAPNSPQQSVSVPSLPGSHAVLPLLTGTSHGAHASGSSVSPVPAPVLA